MKKILLSTALLLTAAAAAAQPSPYASVLEQIEQNSAALAALREQAEARRLARRTGLTPADPEVEFGYLWGHPAADGNRKDLSVRQTFDFPSVYRHRSRLADGQGRLTDLEYRTERMELLLAARRACAELVYCNALGALYAAQLERAQRIADAYVRMEQAGEVSRLDLNKAMLHLTQTETEARQLGAERERLAAELAAMNGGRPVALDAAAYGPRSLPADFERWYAEAEAAHPALQYLKAQVEANGRQVSLARAEALPRFSLGYTGEFIAAQKLQGVTAGMSIPLWENRNRVRQAKAEARASERLMEDARLRYYRRLQALHAQACELHAAVQRYDAVLAEHDNASLLLKALEHGEISLLTYLTEMDYCFSACTERLQAERDLELVLAELEAFRL